MNIGVVLLLKDGGEKTNYLPKPTLSFWIGKEKNPLLKSPTDFPLLEKKGTQGRGSLLFLCFQKIDGKLFLPHTPSTK